MAEILEAGAAWTSAVADALAPLLAKLAKLPTPEMSVGALLAAVVIAFVHLRYRYRRRGRPLSTRRTLALLFPRRFVTHKSHVLDLLLLFGNLLVFAALTAWAIVSLVAVKTATTAALTSVFGIGPWVSVPETAAISIATVVLFLAYEYAYWLEHYLSHRIPLLWEFHKVQHSAEVLTPITNFRVHPVDSVLFANISALVLGVASGVLAFVLGDSLQPYTLLGVNVILFVFLYAIVQLQHSQVWIPFTGLLGHVLSSPAHHQIHHSTDPRHFNKNLGSCLAIYDWMFGTLHMPRKKREKLTFGVAPTGAADHSLVEGVVVPFARAGGHIAAGAGKLRAAAAGAVGGCRAHGIAAHGPGRLRRHRASISTLAT